MYNVKRVMSEFICDINLKRDSSELISCTVIGGLLVIATWNEKLFIANNTIIDVIQKKITKYLLLIILIICFIFSYYVNMLLIMKPKRKTDKIFYYNITT
ncbi:hypothetical protein NLO413_0659 [Candidatus Neoehrlichia lotoris str. RAC413]|uniref:Uncharacterized protein n=1 Tax=Candidatus Neoehrlichia procyonis str. RAC413 TaxID=1359163 RepID=A0A0F3NMK3_9RICK|nr:hypothetical protein NLO413_0659 [Candidatus Neoehrlichia lotoris str. RAC413]